MVMLTCEKCGEAFDAKTKRARFCKRVECIRSRTRARVRSSRRGGAEVVRLPVTPAPEEPEDISTVHAATLAELKAAGRERSALGRAAQALATRIDRAEGDLIGEETGSATASLVRELRATLEAALEGAQRAADGLDDLTAQREKRRSRGA